MVAEEGASSPKVRMVPWQAMPECDEQPYTVRWCKAVVSTADKEGVGGGRGCTLRHSHAFKCEIADWPQVQLERMTPMELTSKHKAR